VLLMSGMAGPVVFLATWLLAALVTPARVRGGLARRTVGVLAAAGLGLLGAVGGLAFVVLVLVPAIDPAIGGPGARLLAVFTQVAPVTLHGMWIPMLGLLWGVEAGSRLG